MNINDQIKSLDKLYFSYHNYNPPIQIEKGIFPNLVADNHYQKSLYDAYEMQNYNPKTADIDRKILDIRVKMNRVKHKIQKIVDSQK
jgi:uncharacterized coiled-coil DUF342 family protein